MKKILAVVSGEKELLEIQRFLLARYGKNCAIAVLYDQPFKNADHFSNLKETTLKIPLDYFKEEDQKRIYEKASFFSKNWYKFDSEFRKKTSFSGIGLGFIYENEVFFFFKRVFSLLLSLSKAVLEEKPSLIVANRNSYAGQALEIFTGSNKLVKAEFFDLASEKGFLKFPNFTRKKLKELREKIPKIFASGLRNKRGAGTKTVFIRERGYLGDLKGKLEKERDLNVFSLDEFLLKKLANPLNAIQFACIKKDTKKDFVKIFNETFSKKAFREKFLFKGMNFSVMFERHTKQMTDRDWPEFVFLIDALSKLFYSKMPDILILWEDFVPFERICSLLAKRIGTKSLVVQHGEFKSVVDGNEINGFAPVISDKIAVWGEMFKESLLNNRVPKTKVVVTGSPRFDTLFLKKFDKVSFKKKISVKPDEKIFVLITSFSFSQQELRTILEKSAKILEKIPKARFVIKIHPMENMVKYQQLVKGKAVVLQYTNLYELLNASEAVIMQSSTVGLEAMILGKPVISFGKRIPLDSIFSSCDAVLRACNGRELATAINKAVEKKGRKSFEKKIKNFVSKACFRIDGLASERIISLAKTMSEEPLFLGVILARAGSKRIKGKNLRELAGKPLIGYTIEAALNSKKLNAVIVSTDSEEIASESRAFGAFVPFMRPKKLAGDESSSIESLRYAVRQFEIKSRKKYQGIVLLQPTSPLRNTEHIDSAVKLFCKTKADSLFSVTQTGKKPKFLVNLKKGVLKFNENQKAKSRKFSLNGAIYIYNRKTLFSNEKYPTGKKSVFFKMPKDASVDIDTLQDFADAKKIIEKKQRGKKFVY